MSTYNGFMSAHKVLYFDVWGVYVDVYDFYVDVWSIIHADRCQVKYNKHSLSTLYANLNLNRV